MGAAYLMNGEEMSRTLTRMAHEIVEQNKGKDFLLLGIVTRGVPLARRLGAELGVPVGELDITMYRDDLRSQPTRVAQRSVLPASIDDQVVVLVDDVLYSGRTVQAALLALADLGRPRRVQLVALVDRGHRELPIQADIVGRRIPTAHQERIVVHLSELDGEDAVLIEARPE
ncbi:bifunctional pyr operon transcriptional regulator/uracil phosphoribosyltransferase PyrR [Tessaracoccus sp. OH4464_COT-324]|uniref:bifunctional pyr operon transcriptional regulator/uracil phosphoribosyltransferase PyrR n=1 Tax=Tessaracoccus sp. OH4464_COT-324 TaxID=2491059 RepID=UPI000F62E376|nr:bifunctional pyr operon transcriptional regulator/uracil phosphoribosyltransferase PyrR [Tessaracoccus sp. OH4464_COT-324]RRD46872.1 bifunctional pyr operon transcriptional regulator/uracil phosphoribosyltransferase PyrR [Tessaracoccus sp. OH4464_COT-324]